MRFRLTYDGQLYSSQSKQKGPTTSGLSAVVWRSANELIKQYGEQADIEARRADEYEAKGDRDGQRVWLRILKAINALQKAEQGETRQ